MYFEPSVWVQSLDRAGQILMNFNERKSLCTFRASSTCSINRSSFSDNFYNNFRVSRQSNSRLYRSDHDMKCVFSCMIVLSRVIEFRKCCRVSVYEGARWLRPSSNVELFMHVPNLMQNKQNPLFESSFALG